MNKGKKKNIFYKFRSKYRFVILNEESLEEKASFKLSRYNVLVIASVLTLFLAALVFLIVAYTPLKEYVPGYADFDTRKDINNLVKKTDSLEQQVMVREKYIENIKKILVGDVTEYTNSKDLKVDTLTVPNTHVDLFRVGKDDSLLRKEFEQDEQYNVMYQDKGSVKDNLKDVIFYPPVNGVITEKFDQNKGHYAVDFATSPNVGVKATLDGTVIEADWNISTGYVIVLQHKNNLISIYKHNSALLKKVGNFVRAGEVIAIIGETGELSHGPHLHFEIWYDGNPLNPENYIAF